MLGPCRLLAGPPAATQLGHSAPSPGLMATSQLLQWLPLSLATGLPFSWSDSYLSAKPQFHLSPELQARLSAGPLHL